MKGLKRFFCVFLTVLMFMSIVPMSDMGIEASAASSNNWSWPTSKKTPSANWPKYSSGSYHSGIDFAVSVGTPVYSTCDGKVVDIKSLTTSYGKHIKIKAKVNGEFVYMRYCHLNSFAVSVDDKVSTGQLIGYSGDTGNSTGPHLHYEVRNSSDAYGSLSSPTLNPLKYLPGTTLTFEVNDASNNENKVEYNGSASYMSGKYYKQLCNVSLTGSSATDIVNVAASQIGYKSGSSDNDLSGSTTSTSDVKYSEYGKKMGSNPNNWCAYFVSWCARRAGISKSILPNFSICQTACDETLPNASCVKHRRSSGYIPKKGDLIFFVNSAGKIYHVGIVKANSDGSVVKYIDGNNTSEGKPNRVHDSSKSLNDSSIWGYYTPNYKQNPVITRANGDNHTEISLKWTKVDNATKYTLERRKAGDDSYKTVKSSITTTSYTDTGLAKNQRYYYKVTAYNDSTKLGTSEAVGAYTKFSPPTLATVSDSQIKLTWSSVSKAESYTVMRRKSGDDEYTSIKKVTDTTFTDSGLSASTQYYYWIQANCNVDGTDMVAKSTTSGRYTLTKAPTIESVNDISKSEIEITWNSVSGAESYRIDRRKAGEDSYKTIKTGLTATSFKDTGLETGQRYYYIVYAKNSAGESAASKAVGGYAKFNEPTVTTVSTSQLKISWNGVAAAESYTIKRRLYNGEYTEIKTVTDTSYTDSGLKSGTQYYYWIQANCNVDGTSIVAKSTAKGQYTQLATPKATTVNSTSIKLSWDMLKGSETYKYVVQRKLSGESAYKNIATATSNTYTDSNLTPSTTYNYRIQVLNDNNSSCSVTNKIDGKTAVCPHSYISKITTYATCKSTGVKTYTCSKCSYSYTETIAKNASNHTGGTEIKNAKTATCTAEGYTGDTYCKGCGVKTKSGTAIAKTAHNSNTTIPAVAATCTKTGLTEGKKCSVCGTVTVTQQTVAKLAHSYTSKVTTAATCKATGVKTYTCSKCSYSYTETIAKNASNHTGGTEIKNAKTATCTAEGYTGDTYCKGCGVKTKSGTAIAKTAHNSNTTIPAVAATCTKTGLTEGKKCSVCGTVTVTQQTVAKTSHTYGSWEVTKTATCTVAGTRQKACTACGNTVTETVKALGHSFGAYISNNDATYKSDGTKTAYCSRCTETKTVSDPGSRLVVKKPYTVKVEQNASAIRLTWNKCEGATGYRIYYKVGSTWKIALNATTKTTHTFTGLKSGTSFTLAIRPYVIANGSVIWSDYLTVTASTAPVAPVAKASSPSKGRITVSWNNVTGGQKYQLFYKSGNGGYKLYNTYDKATSLTFKNLKSGTRFTFAVRAYRTVGGRTIYSSYTPVSVTVK